MEIEMFNWEVFWFAIQIIMLIGWAIGGGTLFSFLIGKKRLALAGGVMAVTLVGIAASLGFGIEVF